MKYHCIGKFMLLLCLVVGVFPLSSEQTYLYRATFIRAAPGKLLDLIDLFKGQMSVYDASGRFGRWKAGNHETGWRK